MAVYGVIRTDLMNATKQPTGMISAKYLPSDVETAIDNGSVVKIGALVSGETTIFAADTPAATDTLASIAIVASVELSDDPRVTLLSDFTNGAGDTLRCYGLDSRDIFSVTKTVLAGKETPAVGDVVELAAGTKLNVASTLTSGSTQVGNVIAIDKVGALTYYVIRVK